MDAFFEIVERVRGYRLPIRLGFIGYRIDESGATTGVDLNVLCEPSAISLAAGEHFSLEDLANADLNFAALLDRRQSFVRPMSGVRSLVALRTAQGR
jgi:hypothetical protein